ncbi:MAG: glucose-6-phosphate isomerase [Candidatus Korarchaeum sp.]|nr:glucose-6-phosphate isomerase [Candidatus Korarchaeum sp.]MDW8035302.1 glucose-6-phosphate isomerase family protein [Candidatus Korarchaeum sp.]
MQIVPGVEFEEEELRLLVYGREVRPEVRWMNDLRSVLMRPEAVKEDFPAYMMYRDLPPLTRSWVRLDLTVIPPWEVGGELAKTKGHYHLPLNGRYLPEVYCVHLGEAVFLLQRRGASPYDVEDFVVVRAKKGSIVTVPPNYGHVTVNFGSRILVMSNFIHREVKPDYGTYELTKGAAYYVTREGIIRNESYSSVPEPRYEEPIMLEDPIKNIITNESFLKMLSGT